MSRYVPIPAVKLDPRGERELVDRASEAVFEASNGLLSDFSDSSPLRAILEGQVFAYSQFLQYFNRIPEALLVEWIGPFLGAQRRTGTASVVDVRMEFSVPTSADTRIPSGFEVSTDPSLNNGVNTTYSLISPLVVPRGSSSATGRFRAKTRGTSGNCLEGSVKRFQPTSGISSITNDAPGFGGTDIETLGEVKERFLSLIRRRVPVSEEDWKGVFQDLFGLGTFSYLDFDQKSNQVNFYFLKPNLEVPNSVEVGLAKNVISQMIPMGFNFNVSSAPVEFVETEVTANFNSLNLSRKEVSDSIRLAILTALQGNALPSEVNLTRQDLIGYVSANLGVGTPYLNPDITSVRVFTKPLDTRRERFRETLKNLSDSGPLEAGDLVSSPNGDKFIVNQEFTISDSSKRYYANEGFLRLSLAEEYESGKEMSTGEVIRDGSGYRVAITSFRTSGEILIDEANGNLTEIKTFSTWVEGNSYSRGVGEVFNPDILEFQPNDLGKEINLPTGSAVWVVFDSFTRNFDSSSLGLVQSLGFVQNTPITEKVLEQGNFFTGDYIVTPRPNGSVDYDPALFFVDPTLGVIQKSYSVLEDFQQEEVLNLRDSISYLEQEGKLREVKLSNEVKVSNFKVRHTSGETFHDGQSVYLVVRDFTPHTKNIGEFLEDGTLINLPSWDINQSRPWFSLNPGDTVSFNKGGGKEFFKVNSSFTPTLNPEVYYKFMERVSSTLNLVPFYDLEYGIEDLFEHNGEFYKVVRPFSTEENDLEELLVEGKIQKIQVELEPSDLIQSSREFVALAGDTLTSISQDGGTKSSFLYSDTLSSLPRYRGDSLF